MAEPGSVAVDAGPKVESTPKSDAQINIGAPESKPKAFDAAGIKALLNQKPEDGLQALASGAGRSDTESQEPSTLPTLDNPLIINAPNTNGEVTVTRPKLDTTPADHTPATMNADTTAPQNEQKPTDAQDGPTPGRFGQFKDAVKSKFGYKPLNTPQIDALDLTRQNTDTAQNTTQTESSTPSANVEAQTAQTLDAQNSTESQGQEIPKDKSTTEPETQGLPKDASAKDLAKLYNAPSAPDNIADRNQPTNTVEQNLPSTPGQQAEFAPPVQQQEASPKIDSKTETEGDAEAEKSMRTRRDEVVAQLSRNNPDIDVGDPKVQAMLDEAEGDPAKMEQTEKVLKIIDQKTQESADLVKTLGLPKELVGQLAKGELKSLINVLQEAAKALDADASKKDAAETKNMHWLIKLLLVLAAASIAIPVGAVAVGAGQLQGQSK